MQGDSHMQRFARVSHVGSVSRVASVLLCCSVLSACLDNDLPPPDEQPEAKSFLAQQGDFADFREWMSFKLGSTDSHAGVAGDVVMYVNRLPKSGAKTFPVGTMIAKTVRDASSGALTIHAMAKRGGNFNAQGALGWEFFELQINKQDVAVMIWRGANPPTGESYQLLPGVDTGDMEVQCNDCHTSSHNDAVLDDMLELESL